MSILRSQIIVDKVNTCSNDSICPVAGIPGALNAAGTGQEDNFYPYEETPVKYLFVTEKYLPATGRGKFVHETNFIVRWQ